MMRAVFDVVRGEGLASAGRRAGERVAEAAQRAALRARGVFAGGCHASILNFAAASIAPRTGGVAIQLLARLREESKSRTVALLHPGGLRFATHERRTMSIRDALALTGAKAVQIDGTSGIDPAEFLRLIDGGVEVIVAVHDFTLMSMPLAGELLAAACGAIFPSEFLHDEYARRFDFRGEVIEPAAGTPPGQPPGRRRSVAFAGAVKRHKGAHLLPEIARAMRGRTLHVFGGGDVDLLRALRREPNLRVHGYYRSGTLPQLLARHGVGLVLLPSVVPESYCLALSESWLAGASVAAFDLGAQAERIRRHGGGWLAPPDSGAAGLVQLIEQWISGATSSAPAVTTPAEAARAHLALYARWFSPAAAPSR